MSQQKNNEYSDYQSVQNSGQFSQQNINDTMNRQIIDDRQIRQLFCNICKNDHINCIDSSEIQVQSLQQMKNKIEEIQSYHKVLIQRISYMQGYLALQKHQQNLLRQQIEQIKQKREQKKKIALFSNESCLTFHYPQLKQFTNSFGNYQNYLKCAKYLYKKQGVYNKFSIILYENQNLQVLAQYSKKQHLEKEQSKQNSLKKKENYLSIDLQANISFPDFVRVLLKKLNPKDKNQYLLKLGKQKKVCHSFQLDTYEQNRKNLQISIVDNNNSSLQRVIDKIYVPTPLNYFLQKRFTYESDIKCEYYEFLLKTLYKITVQIRNVQDLKGYYFLKEILTFQQQTWQWYSMKGLQQIIFIHLQGVQMVSQPNSKPIFSICFTVGMKKISHLMKQIIQYLCLMII